MPPILSRFFRLNFWNFWGTFGQAEIVAIRADAEAKVAAAAAKAKAEVNSAMHLMIHLMIHLMMHLGSFWRHLEWL